MEGLAAYSSDSNATAGAAAPGACLLGCWITLPRDVQLCCRLAANRLYIYAYGPKWRFLHDLHQMRKTASGQRRRQQAQPLRQRTATLGLFPAGQWACSFVWSIQSLNGQVMCAALKRRQ